MHSRNFSGSIPNATAERRVRSTCGICSVGCGVEIGVAANQIVAVRGRADHRVSYGRLGPKGSNQFFANGKIARAALGTANIDANTRLCTATTASSLMESFGADGPPGAFEDFDQTECIVLIGHNAAHIHRRHRCRSSSAAQAGNERRAAMTNVGMP